MIVASVLILSSTTAKHAYRFNASFIEGCSCKDVCVTEITGTDAGCHGLGAIHFKSGSYDGHDLANTSASFAWDSGKWVSLTIDAPQNKRTGVTALMKAFLADWGKMEPVAYGEVKIKRSGQNVVLETGKSGSAQLTVKPVFGGDGKTAICHTNLASPMHSSLNQGQTVSGKLTQPQEFELKGTNGFYNLNVTMKGKI